MQAMVPPLPQGRPTLIRPLGRRKGALRRKGEVGSGRGRYPIFNRKYPEPYLSMKTGKRKNCWNGRHKHLKIDVSFISGLKFEEKNCAKGAGNGQKSRWQTPKRGARKKF